MLRDTLGNPLTGATDEARTHYETALRELQCYRSDPLATIDKAIEAAPGFVMAHAFRAWLNLLGTEPEGIPEAHASIKAATEAAKGGATEGELGHLAALDALGQGYFMKASRIMEDVTIAQPRDALGLLAGHQIDFFTGRSRLLRDRIARALPHWDDAMPGYHSVLGMHAFGLEESGEYAKAEAAGRKGVELEFRDGWSQHAVAHVMEMMGRHAEGVDWMEKNVEGWAGDSFLQVHNWWHLALYYLDVADFDAALKLHDEHIGAGHAVAVLDKLDSSALLWRLHMRGVDVSERFAATAALWEPLATAGNYSFNDAHAVMAFVGAGRFDLCDEVLATQDEVMKTDVDNAEATRRVGRPVCEGLIAFGKGDYRTALEKLRPVRNTAWLFGGSHAQRDVIDLTMIEAAFRAGDTALAGALAAERLEAKHDSPLSQLFVKRAAEAAQAA